MYNSTWTIAMAPMQTAMAKDHSFALSCHDTAIQSCTLPLVGWNTLQQQLHLQPGSRPLCLEPPSLEIKQEHVESDYTRGTLLCPLQSDDGDDWLWIFRTPAVNILTCQRCTSPSSTPIRLYAGVKHWSWPLPNYTTPPLPFLFSLSREMKEWANCQPENQWKWLIVLLVSEPC